MPLRNRPKKKHLFSFASFLHLTMVNNNPEPFHLGFPVNDIEETRAFYGDLLNCKIIRSSDTTINIDFWGHQLVGHLVPDVAGEHGHNEIDGNDVPIPHFGAILDWTEWENLVERVNRSDVEFVIDPYVRDRGTPEEEGKMFIQDPSGNTLEFKTFKNEEQRFV